MRLTATFDGLAAASLSTTDNPQAAREGRRTSVFQVVRTLRSITALHSGASATCVVQ